MRSRLLCSLKGLQHLFGPRAHSNVFGKIHPADRTRGINEKLCRAGNIRAFGPRAAMQQVVTPNYFRLGIGQERVGVAKFLSLAPVDFRCVHTNRNYLNPARFKVRKPLLETPQLGVAQWSPETAIKNQRDGFRSANEITKRHVVPILIRQRKLGRLLSDSRRCGRRRDLPQLVEQYVGK
jgi:hypothetical protein